MSCVGKKFDIFMSVLFCILYVINKQWATKYPLLTKKDKKNFRRLHLSLVLGC